MLNNILPIDLQKVHMVGIGGIGMSSLAHLILDCNGLVSGSDIKESCIINKLRSRGAKINIGHNASYLDLLPGGVSSVIITKTAIPKNNPELLEAQNRKITILFRPTVLAKLMMDCTAIVVAGTHGKTTTTAMLISVMRYCHFNPSFSIGGELCSISNNAFYGSGKYFVTEVDESDGSLLEFNPNILIVTNIDVDHLDFFGNPQAYSQIFFDFVERIKPGGSLVVCTDSPGSALLADYADKSGIKVLRYGTLVNKYSHGLILNFKHKGIFTVVYIKLAGNFCLHKIYLKMPNKCTALNALAVFLVAIGLGAPVDKITKGLMNFKGVQKRFELIGIYDGIHVFNDYAHHPTEIKTTLESALIIAKQFNSKVIAIFQPHLYSRTANFATEFGNALSNADRIFILDIYGAREGPLPGVNSTSIAKGIVNPAAYITYFPVVIHEVVTMANYGDIIITMGAGDVTLLGKEIFANLRKNRVKIM